MNKIIKPIKQLFRYIFKILDRIIVMPITKLVYKTSNKVDKPSKVFEKWLSKPNTLLVISLILAIAIFIVIDQKIILFSESSATVLKKQPVNVIYNEENYVIEGIPETVDITLIGSKTNLYIAKQSPVQDIEVDLSGYGPGSYKVDINYNNVSSSLEYSVNPSVATVIIYPKISKIKTLMIDVLNQDDLDPTLVVSEVINNTDEVVIKGAEYQLNKVATVKALVDINNLVKQEVGNFSLKNVPLKAYDEQGNVVDIEILPNTIDTEIVIDSPSKEVPIKVTTTGEISFGKAISTFELSSTKVTVFGSYEALANIDYVAAEININGLNKNQQYKVELNKPTGVRTMSVNSVTIDVNIDTVTEKDVENVGIDVRNLNEKFKAQGATEEDVAVTISVKGVESVIKDIDATTIIAYVDLTNYKEPGTYDVDVKIESNDSRITYLSKTKKVKIIISKK